MESALLRRRIALFIRDCGSLTMAPGFSGLPDPWGSFCVSADEQIPELLFFYQVIPTCSLKRCVGEGLLSKFNPNPKGSSVGYGTGYLPSMAPPVSLPNEAAGDKTSKSVVDIVPC